MNANEIAIYAAETKMLIQVLWGLLLAASIALVGLAILYVLLRQKMRSTERRETQMAHSVAVKSEEIARLEARIAKYAELEEGVDGLKTEVRRADAIRGKTEERLRQQNAELETLKLDAVKRMAELELLRKAVEHIDTSEPARADLELP